MRNFELKLINDNPQYKWRVYNHNNTLLGVFPNRNMADKEAQFYREVTGNPAYVQHEEVA